MNNSRRKTRGQGRFLKEAGEYIDRHVVKPPSDSPVFPSPLSTPKHPGRHHVSRIPSMSTVDFPLLPGGVECKPLGVGWM